jgi:small-conductance mechanosensitive channel
MKPFSIDMVVSLLLSAWVVGPIVFIVWLAVLLPLRASLLRITKRYIEAHAKWFWADALIEALSPALLIAIVASGLALLDRVLPLSPRVDHVVGIALAAAVALAMVLFFDRLCRRLLERLTANVSTLQGVVELIQGGVRGLIIGVGLLIFLDSIGISITPVIASLGIGSLAVALALQDTLANLFAGVYMIADRPIQVGHFVRLEGGYEGYVSKVGWRSSQIQMLHNNVVVVPNSKLAGSIITNFSLPETELMVPVEIGVRYDSDLEKVERVTVDVARDVMRSIGGGVPGFDPYVRYHTFGESAINFTVFLRATHFEANHLIRHEFLKRLHAAYRAEEIIMPFPVRSIEVPREYFTELREILALRNASEAAAGGSP